MLHQKRLVHVKLKGGIRHDWFVGDILIPEAIDCRMHIGPCRRVLVRDWDWLERDFVIGIEQWAQMNTWVEPEETVGGGAGVDPR
jgi:hypothetical protein